VIPRAHTQRGQAAYDVGYDVIEIELPTVRQEALQKLGADASYEGADGEREVQCASAVGVEDPVEDDCEEEEGEQMEDFVVYVGVELKGGEARITGEEAEQEENA
jgi:hypothetical protein